MKSLRWIAFWFRDRDGTWARQDRAGRAFWFGGAQCKGIPLRDAPADLGALEAWMQHRGFERAEIVLEVHP